MILNGHVVKKDKRCDSGFIKGYTIVNSNARDFRYNVVYIVL